VENNYFLGIDIGGTKCAVIAGTSQMEILDRVQFDSLTVNGPEYAITKLLETASAMVRQLPGRKLLSVGISCGGPLDSRRGVILSPPNLPGWDNIPIVQLFQEKFGVPVAVQNDANACALAEWFMGAGKGTSNMVFLTFGTGLGAGLILNGQIYAGTNDLGGEVGHIRLEKDGPVGFGKAGSFEGFCSGGGIAQLAKTMVKNKFADGQKVGFCLPEDLEKLDARTVANAANSGDTLANDIIRISAEYLGKGLAIIIDTLNPECIVIGSVYARNEHLFKPHVDRILKEEAIPSALEVCVIKPALLGDSIGDFAALSVAVNNYKNNKA
jgi:glucokinase